MPTTYIPPKLPSTRILGATTPDRRMLLIKLDVIVGYVSAKYRHQMHGWEVEAALVDPRSGFRGGERVALRALPKKGISLLDIAPIPGAMLDEIIERIDGSIEGISALVLDIASIQPDVEGTISECFDRPTFFGFGDDSAIA